MKKILLLTIFPLLLSAMDKEIGHSVPNFEESNISSVKRVPLIDPQVLIDFEEAMKRGDPETLAAVEEFRNATDEDTVFMRKIFKLADNKEATLELLNNNPNLTKKLLEEKLSSAQADTIIKILKYGNRDDEESKEEMEKILGIK